MFVNLTIQVLWICFAPISGVAAEFYGVSELRVGLLAMLFMIVFIPLSLPASWAIDTFGFRKSVGFGAVLLAVFGLLRGFYAGSFPVVLVMTIGIAAAQPFLLNAFTKVAAVWFAYEERATAVGLATIASFAGIIVGEVLTPVLVGRYGIGRMQLIYGAAAAISAVVFLAVAREKPPTPAGPAGHEERALVLDGLRQMFKERAFYYIAVAFLVAGGIFNGLSTWVEGIARPKGLSPAQAGNLAGLTLVGAIVGAVILPLISDRMRRRKPILLLGLVLAVPSLAVLTFATSYAVELAAFFAVGLFMIGIAPVLYQYLSLIHISEPTRPY